MKMVVKYQLQPGTFLATEEGVPTSSNLRPNLKLIGERALKIAYSLVKCIVAAYTQARFARLVLWLNLQSSPK